MELTSFIILLCITLSFLHLLSSNFRRRRVSKLPPGPNPLPIIGNILQLGPKPHQSLTNLSKIYGPLMHLKLDSIDTVVVSSPDIAKEILQHHDHGFPDRMTTAATKALGHNRTSVACLPVGKQWRILRRICREQMFSTQRLDASRELRREKLQKLIGYVQKCCDDRKVVNIREAAFVTSLNLISNTLFSVDFADYSEGSSQELSGVLMLQIIFRLSERLIRSGLRGTPSVISGNCLQYSTESLIGEWSSVINGGTSQCYRSPLISSIA